MRLVVLSGIISVLTVFIGTPLLIKLLLKHGYSQAIRVSTEGEPYPEHEGTISKLRNASQSWLHCRTRGMLINMPME